MDITWVHWKVERVYLVRSMYHCDTRSQGCLSGELYGSDLLFHPPYPTRLCGEVTTRTEPSDTVPTGFCLAPEP